MAYELNIDLRLIRGEDYEKNFRIYSDTRVKRWRGGYRENYLYKKGDGVQVAGEAWVSDLQGSNTEPGGPGSGEFWSLLQTLNLTGYTANTVAEPEGVWAGFQTPAQLEVSGGKLTIAIQKALFSAAPVDSAHFFVELISPLGVTTHPVKGTMLFGSP